MNTIGNLLAVVDSFRMSIYFDIGAGALALAIAAWLIVFPERAGSMLRNKWSSNKMLLRSSGVVVLLWTLLMLAHEFQDRIGMSSIPSPRGFLGGLTVGLLLAVLLMEQDKRTTT